MEYKKRTYSKYFNANYKAACIVAVANFRGDTIFDWAVYINGVDPSWTEREATEFVASCGCKMAEKDAKALFPFLPAGKYRR